MKLEQLIKELQKLESKYGTDVNVEFNIEADAWGYEEYAVAHEIDQTHGWDDSKNQKWVNIYLR